MNEQCATATEPGWLLHVPPPLADMPSRASNWADDAVQCVARRCSACLHPCPACKHSLLPTPQRPATPLLLLVLIRPALACPPRIHTAAVRPPCGRQPKVTLSPTAAWARTSTTSGSARCLPASSSGVHPRQLLVASAHLGWCSSGPVAVARRSSFACCSSTKETGGAVRPPVAGRGAARHQTEAGVRGRAVRLRILPPRTSPAGGGSESEPSAEP